jgi:hypothetical protein
MTIFSLDELKNLVQNPEYPCVSLYLPMEKLGGETRQNPIRFKNLIREAKVHQIPSVMQTSQKDGMITMEKSIEVLTQSGVISGAIE